MKSKLRVLSLTLLLFGSTLASAGDLVRVDFHDETLHAALGGIFGEPLLLSGTEDPDDDLFVCGDDHFDYLDIEDDDSTCSPAPSLEGIAQSDVSGGGRWMMSSITGTDLPSHAVGFNFSDVAGGADCSALADLSLGQELGGDTCACGSICFVQARMTADRAFKKGATRQAFTIQVLQQSTDGYWPPRLDIDFVEPLYLCPGATRSERWLQTTSCDGAESAAEAELIAVSSTNQRSNIGRWELPIRLRLSRTPRSAGDPDDGGFCELKGKGDACDSGSECCSGKCTGKSGAQTCR